MEDKNWHQIYLEKIKLVGPRDYLLKKVIEKRILIEKIAQNTPQNGRIIEMGCGTAVLSTYLRNVGYQVTCLDSDQGMLDIAQDIARNFRLAPIFIKGDVTNLNLQKGSFDTSFSNGVLEHFSDEEITRAIKIQGDLCQKVIVSIPSTYFNENEKIYGDERFLSKKKWRELIKGSCMRITKEFEFNYSGESLLEDGNIVIRSLISGVKPYIGFVLENLRQEK